MNLMIYAVGDIMLGEQGLCYNFGVKSIIEKKGIDYLFRDVKDILKGGDIVFGNLEAPISNYTDKMGFEANFFRANPNVIEGLKNANFNVLSIANNHISEHGENAFWSTVNNLKKNNIIPVGVINETEIIEIKNFKIAIMAYSFIEDYYPYNSLYNKINSEKKILEDIKKIRNSVDLIILSLHWGDEYVPLPSSEQIEIGRKFIDCGVDIILGGHPHVLQSYEIYKKKPIIYSLGNFIFDHTYIKSTRESIIAQIIVDINTKDILIDVIPIICDPSEYCPTIEKKNKDKNLKKISIRRNIIENTVVSGSVSIVGDYSTLVNKYKKDSNYDMKIQFLKNLYRYPLSLSIKILYQYFAKILNSKYRGNKK